MTKLMPTGILLNQQPIKKAPAKKSNEEQFDLFGFNDELDEPTTTNHSYYATLENTTHFYQSIQGDLPVKLLLQNLLNQTSVCFDTETTGIDALNAELVGMSIFFRKRKRILCSVSRKSGRSSNSN